MAGFDDILKNGKKAVSSVSPENEMTMCVSLILSNVHKLNNIYKGNSDECFVHSIDSVQCIGCDTTLFILVASDLSDKTKKQGWYLSSCSYSKLGYLCDKCTAKKGKK